MQILRVFCAGSILACAQLMLIGQANAGLIMSASIMFDNGSFGGTSGSFSVISNGVSNSSTFSGDTASQNTVLGDIAQIGDGITIDSDALDIIDAEYLVGLDALISIENTHLTSIYDLIFDLDFMNLVFSSGDDAFATTTSNIVDTSTNDELFFTDIISDSEPSQGLLGGTVSDSDTQSFAFTLNPGDLLELAFSFTQEGGEFAGTGESESQFDQAFLLSSLRVTNPNPNPNPISTPSTTLFSAFGLIFLLFSRVKRS